jgi:peptidoglycan/LPS O-acetylase OafA/YrhL
MLIWFGVPRQVTHAIRVHNIADELSVSITSMMARILGPHGVSNPKILALATAVGLITLAIVALLYRARSFPLLRWPPRQQQETQPFKGLVAMEWAGLIVVALAFSPDTNTRHLVLTLLLNLLAAVIVLTPRPRINRTPAVIGVLVIFFSYMMPFGTQNSAPHLLYFRYAIPCWGLLIGYLLILHTGLHSLASQMEGMPRRHQKSSEGT